MLLRKVGERRRWRSFCIGEAHMKQLYICDPEKNITCRKGNGCQEDCFLTDKIEVANKPLDKAIKEAITASILEGYYRQG